MVHISLGGLLVLLIPGSLGEAYLPGSPGAAWSVATQKAVKAKLYNIFSPHQSLGLYKKMHPEAEEVTDTSVTVNGVKQKWESMPNSAKVLRLGFHGCFPKIDGEGKIAGACNGCLNTKGMYVRFDSRERSANGQCSADDSEVSHSNGLGPTLEILEKIYKDPKFPPLSTQLKLSPFDQGISRADFWAFAAITAVEYGIDMNNVMCDEPDHLSALNMENYRYDSGTSGIHRHGSIHHGEPDCKIPKQEFNFTTGRIDCIPQAEESGFPAYHTDDEENAPNHAGNGAATVNYFKKNFGMTGQETVAIMGSHTLGMFNFQHNLYHYTWTSRGLEQFNNDYYSILGALDRYQYNQYAPHKTLGRIPLVGAGDPYGNPAKTKWKIMVRWDNLNCGPVFWRHDYRTCPDCHIPEDTSVHQLFFIKDPERKCCTDAPVVNGTQLKCIPNGMDPKLRCEVEIFQRDPETAMNAEMGLVYDFEVTEDGYPTGCPGIPESFNGAAIKAGGNRGVSNPRCPKQMLAEPPTDKPVSDYVQDYALDRGLWFRDYAAVLEKMLSNGYEKPLTLNPSVSLTCDTPRIYPLGSTLTINNRCPTWQCYQEGEKKGNAGLFQLRAKRKGRKAAVLAQEEESELRLENIFTTRCSPAQLWQIDEDMIVNGDGQQMTVDGVSSFQLVPNSRDDKLVSIKAVGSDKFLMPERRKMQVTLGAEYAWQIIRV